ncbi:MAG: efflux RND transporter periplasmic adaptor subunit [Lachnospiraceae bacterium]|jgi:RND family efflux transporter MFP subunit|nr:efflux RND transporter periplasmic adaptor subunit [Lachnospiraceae bacterium]
MIGFRKKEDIVDGSQKEKKAKNPARRKKRIKQGIVLIVVLALAGGFIVHSKQKADVPPQVMATTVTRGDVETMVSTSGVVESEISQVYYAPMAAKVSDLNVELGDAVKAGDVLLAYDTEDLEFKQKSDALDAQANENSYQSSIAESNKQENIYNESTAQLANIEYLIDFQKDLIKQFQYYVEDEKTERKLKLYDERYRLNRRINNLNVQAYIEDTEGVHVSQAQAMNELEEINQKIEELEDDKELTEIEREIVTQQEVLADLEEMRDELKSDKNSSENAILDSYKKKELAAIAEKSRIAEQQAQAHLEEALAGIKADFNGIITELDINEGYVTEAGSKLMKLESSDDVRVNISLSKYDLSKVELGQKAEVEISGHTYEGTVSKINRMAEKNDAGTRLVAAEVHIENPDDNIYLGVEGKVKIMSQKSENTLMVPIAAVNTDQAGDFCYVVKDGVLERREITAGLSSEDSIEIVEGLEEGDIVLTDTSMELTEGMQIEPLIM